jgi:hypothetical protein
MDRVSTRYALGKVGLLAEMKELRAHYFNHPLDMKSEDAWYFYYILISKSLSRKS